VRLHAEREARTAQALADEQQLAAGRARVEELRAAQEEAAAAAEARASVSTGDGRQEAALSEQSKALQAGLMEAARRLEVVTEQLRRQTDALHSTLAGKAGQESERAQLLKTVAALEAAAEAAAAAGAAHAAGEPLLTKPLCMLLTKPLPEERGARRGLGEEEKKETASHAQRGELFAVQRRGARAGVCY
jgi:hypothetical protein